MLPGMWIYTYTLSELVPSTDFSVLASYVVSSIDEMMKWKENKLYCQLLPRGLSHV